MKNQLALFLILLVIAQVSSHPGCGIHLLKHSSQLIDQKLEKSDEALRKSSSEASLEKWTPIRIAFDYSLIDSDPVMSKSAEYVQLITTLSKAAQVFSSLIKVKSRKYFFGETCGDDIKVPVRYTQKNGYGDADLVIFARFDNTGSFATNRIEAAAVHCQQENISKRPIAGYITFRKGLFTPDSVKMDYMLWLTLHEMTHVLVFNEFLFKDWPSTGLLGGTSAIIQMKTRPDGTNMKVLKTPKILELGKKHFNCTTFDGIPLDYQGGKGTSGSHWAKRYMNTDYMIGDSYGENVISPLTLAMFEDSKWYTPNYTKSNMFLWGKDQGCSFFDLNTKCAQQKDNILSSPFSNSFCSKPNRPVCSVGNVFRATCKTKSQMNVPVFHQYFTDPTTVGWDQLSDYCPIPIESKTVKNPYYGGSCRNGQTLTINGYEKVCPSCACFTGTITYNDYRKAPQEKKSYSLAPSATLKKRKTKQDDEEEVWSTYCLEYKCRVAAGTTKLLVTILLQNYECPEGQTISIPGFTGSLVCPPTSVLCKNAYLCKFGCPNGENK